jgi:hypothetical protein
LQVDVYDLTGRRVKRFKGEFSSETLFDVSALKPALYFVKIYSDKGSAVKKLFIR